MSYKNIVATIGTYQKDGQTKYINRTVGKLIETQHGPKIKLDATFNPAGCIKDEEGGVWLSLFDPKPKEFAHSNPQNAYSASKQGPTAESHFEGDDVPWL